MSNTPENKNPIPTPTYQGNLNYISKLIIDNRAFGNVEGTWNTLLLFYDCLPPECAQDVTPLYNQIRQHLETIHTKYQKIATRDNVYADLKLNNEREKFLRGASRELHREINKSMLKHNWFVRDLTIKPRIEAMPEI